MRVNSKCLNLLSRLPLLEENFVLSYSKSMFFYDKNMRYQESFVLDILESVYFCFFENFQKDIYKAFLQDLGERLMLALTTLKML